ncbi:MAG: hypothetical protein Q9217_000392 [Psora testacea]
MYPGQQLSQIEKSVTHLLIATKQLLETLTQWSRHNSTEGEVSDVYVRLGYEFNIACRAFNGIGVDTSDLGPVPELLRAILEETLSQEASPASLDKFLPRIRDIIITLLHGLKRKQQRLRAKQGKDNPQYGVGLSASASSSSLNTGLTQMLEDVPSRKSGRGSERRTGSSGSTFGGDMTNGSYSNGDGAEAPPHYPSMAPARQSGGGAPPDASNRVSNRDSQRPFPNSLSDSSISSATSQTNSVLALNSDNDAQQMEYVHTSTEPKSQKDTTSYLRAPPPPPPPKQQDALAALQRGGDLERRASRRYSAYQISKHLGASPNGMPMLPPAQNTPVPNRGRDLRDSMNAVRTRGSGIYSRQRSNNRAGELSPARNNALSNRISEESTQSGGSRHAQAALSQDEGVRADEDRRRKAVVSPGSESPQMGATLTSPSSALPAYYAAQNDDAESRRLERQSAGPSEKLVAQVVDGEQAVQQFVPEQSPQPGKELTLFLQYKSKIKKYVLPEGSNDLSVARLQLAFIEKFAWNTHSNGNDLPEIYIQDPVSGVRHELEDLRDVKDRCVLVLNVEALDEVKKHIDEGLGGIRKLVEGVRNAVDSQHVSLQRVSERQQGTSREVQRLSTKSDSIPAVTNGQKTKSNPIASTTLSKRSVDQASNIQSLRQDLAVVRQTFTSLVSDVNVSMANVQEKALSLKTMAIEGVVPNLDASTGRSYVNAGKKTLGEESERIVNRVDDLQDIVEDLRKDVVTRGVRPLPRQLESVSKSISTATSELKKMQGFLKREKPIWTKIWEKELEVVCNDRDLLTMQEELATDLEDDLEKATQTFALVEQATKQQNLQSGQGSGVNLRSTSKGLAAIASDQEIDPMKAKDGVLGEVRALRPNHETRLEAIERSEKARQRELETRKEGEFTKEVASFVEEGRLKKSGGFEEAERLRKARDEKYMREAWEKQQERAAGKGKEAEAGPLFSGVPEQLSGPVDLQMEQTQLEEQPQQRRQIVHQEAKHEPTSEEEGERLMQAILTAETVTRTCLVALSKSQLELQRAMAKYKTLAVWSPAPTGDNGWRPEMEPTMPTMMIPASKMLPTVMPHQGGKKPTRVFGGCLYEVASSQKLTNLPSDRILRPWSATRPKLGEVVVVPSQEPKWKLRLWMMVETENLRWRFSIEPPGGGANVSGEQRIYRLD